MTEGVWLMAVNPVHLLRILRKQGHCDSYRKLLLFCLTYGQRYLGEPGCALIGPAIEHIEAFADGLADENAVDDLWRRADAVIRREQSSPPTKPCQSVAWFLICGLLSVSTKDIPSRTRFSRALRLARGLNRTAITFACGRSTGVQRKLAERIINTRASVYLREVFGNPFRPVTFAPSWLTSTVVALATSIYADRAFDRMPILADALEKAGCDNRAILTHCRGDGPHVRGCWVLDKILGKE